MILHNLSDDLALTSHFLLSFPLFLFLSLTLFLALSLCSWDESSSISSGLSDGSDNLSSEEFNAGSSLNSLPTTPIGSRRNSAIVVSHLWSHFPPKMHIILLERLLWFLWHWMTQLQSVISKESYYFQVQPNTCAQCVCVCVCALAVCSDI